MTNTDKKAVASIKPALPMHPERRLRQILRHCLRTHRPKFSILQTLSTESELPESCENTRERSKPGTQALLSDLESFDLLHLRQEICRFNL
jgi:hypothetical protein